MKSEQLRLFQYSTFLTYLLVLEHSEFKTFLLDILDCSYKCPIAVYSMLEEISKHIIFHWARK